MLEKTDPQASTIRRPFDQAGNVRHHKAAVAVRLHHPEIRDQSSKRIIRHFRLGRGNGTNQRALARIGHTQQTHIRQHLKLQTQAPGLAGLTLGGFTRRLVHTALEVDIAQPATTGLGHHHWLVGGSEVRQHLFRIQVDHGGTHRHIQNDIVSGFAGHLPTLARLTIPRLENTVVPVIHQGVDIGIGLHIDMTAGTTVSAVRPAELHVFLATKAQTAVTALSGMDINSGFIDKLHGEQTLNGVDAILRHKVRLGTRKTHTKKPRGREPHGALRTCSRSIHSSAGVNFVARS